MDAGGKWEYKVDYLIQPKMLSYLITLAYLSLQNDVSDIPDLTFSMDADEEKHILYEKTEVGL